MRTSEIEKEQTIRMIVSDSNGNETEIMYRGKQNIDLAMQIAMKKLKEMESGRNDE